MRNYTVFLTIGVMILLCATSSYAQQNELTLEQRMQFKQALINGDYPDNGNAIKAPFRNDVRLKTENYTQHLTPLNTGENELSTFYISDVFIDSQGRYYFKSSFSRNYALDVYDTNDNSWSQLEVGEELPANVNSFVEVGPSEVWIGTNDGLFKYNSDYVLEDSLDLNTDSMPSNIITNLHYDSNGHIWAVQESYYERVFIPEDGNYDTTYVNGGVTLFDPADKTIIARSDTMSFELQEIVSKHGIRDIAEDTDGNIWATTAVGHGIAVFAADGSSAMSYTSENSDLPDNGAILLETGWDGNMWVSLASDSTKVLASYDGNNWITYGTDVLPFSYCGAMTAGSSNQLYCIDEAVYSYDGTDWTEITDVTVKGETLKDIAFISSANGVDIFRPIGPGVFIKEGENWDYMSSHTDNGLFSNVLFTTSTDDQNGLWTSGFYGSAYFDGTDWTYYDESDGLANSYSWKIRVASDGTVWFGTTDGVSYLKDGTIETYDQYPEFFGEDIYEDRDGNMWFGSYNFYHEEFKGGILKYDGEEFTLFPADSVTIQGVNLGFAQGPDDMMYAKTIGFNSEIIRYDGEEWSTWNPDSTIFSGYTKLEVDSNHNLYFLGSDTTDGGKLFQWDGDSFSRYEVPEGCSSGAEAMEADSEDNLWIECRNIIAIFNIEEESWITHELPVNRLTFIYDITHDGEGTSWVATYYNGLFKFDTFRAVSNEEFANTTPNEFKLNQNYPNPFNPNTVISYQLPIDSRVTLKVYDILGREVATLINANRQTAGQHQISFDASHLASGMYIYRLNSDNFTATRKMMLIK